VKRGEIWTVSGGAPDASKPRPAVPLLRMLVEPTDYNGMTSASRLMIDKLTTVPKARIGKRLGKLNDEDVVRLNRSLTVFLGLARCAKSAQINQANRSAV
jgi:mRNA interferase MazF